MSIVPVSSSGSLQPRSREPSREVVNECEREKCIHQLTLTGLRQYAEMTFVPCPIQLSPKNWVKLNQNRMNSLSPWFFRIIENSGTQLTNFQQTREHKKQLTRNLVNGGGATCCINDDQKKALANLISAISWIESLKKEMEMIAFHAQLPEQEQHPSRLQPMLDTQLQNAKVQLESWKEAIAVDRLPKQNLFGHSLQDKPAAARQVICEGFMDAEASAWMKQLGQEVHELENCVTRFERETLPLLLSSGLPPEKKKWNLYIGFCQSSRLFGNLEAASEFFKTLKLETGEPKYDIALGLIDSSYKQMQGICEALLVEMGKEYRGVHAELPVPPSSGSWSVWDYVPLWGSATPPNDENSQLRELGKRALKEWENDLKAMPVECTRRSSFQSSVLTSDMFDEREEGGL